MLMEPVILPGCGNDLETFLRGADIQSCAMKSKKGFEIKKEEEGNTDELLVALSASE